MNTSAKNKDDRRNFSKRDSSGTDPNRYAHFSVEEAEKLIKPKHSCNSLIPGVEANVSTVERILMVVAGGYLLYNSLSKKNKSVGQAIAGTTMLARGISGYCPVYDSLGKGGRMKSTNINIRTSVSINRPIDEVYDFWRDLENLPKFMQHLESVEQKDKVTSRWTASGPGGIGKISWDAHILMDEKGEMLSWHSLPESTVNNAGKVLFSDNGNGGTDLDITISYHAPLGVAGEAAAKLLNPFFERMVESDIQSLKTYMEMGISEKNM